MKQSLSCNRLLALIFQYLYSITILKSYSQETAVMERPKDKEASSFFFDEQSEASIMVLPKKTEQQIFNESLLKQISQLRSQNRQLKHENIWLKDYKEGVSQECQTIKQLYRSNKQAVCKMNADLRIANEEINRLEDLINQKQFQQEQTKERIKQYDDKIGEYENEINSLKIIVAENNMKIQFLEKQVNEQKNEKFAQSAKQMTIFNDKLIEIVNRLDISPSKTHRSTSSHHLPSSPQQESPYQLIHKLESLLEQEKESHQFYKQETRRLEQKIDISSKKYDILECQLKQASELIEILTQQRKEMKEQSQKIQKQNQSKGQQALKEKEKSMQILLVVFKKIGDLMSLFIPDQEFLVSKLINLSVSLVKNNSVNYCQCDILINELKTIIYQRNCKINTVESEKQSKKRLERKVQSLSEQLQMLKLRHGTLQRQYDAVMEDNRRIIKYHSLSRYRVERNMRESDKQNKGLFSNIETTVKYQK